MLNDTPSSTLSEIFTYLPTINLIKALSLINHYCNKTTKSSVSWKNSNLHFKQLNLKLLNHIITSNNPSPLKYLSGLQLDFSSGLSNPDEVESFALLFPTL